jgi:hypothetical protein
MSILKYAYINHAMVSRWTRYGTGNKDAASRTTLAMLTSESLLRCLKLYSRLCNLHLSNNISRWVAMLLHLRKLEQ